VPFQPPIGFNILALAGPPALVLRLSGEGQTGVIGALLSQPFVTSVIDVFGNPASGVPVTWSVLSGDGTLEEASAVTDASGLASARFRLGGTPGPNLVRAAVGPPPLQVEFAATGVLGAADSLSPVSGDSASAAPGSTLPAFVVRVIDHFGHTFAGVPVTWEILLGDGTLSGTTSLSDANGIASMVYRLGPTAGKHEIQARIPSGAGYIFTAFATP
jgi:adhesin/invasin